MYNARVNSLNLFSNVEGVKIDCHPADDIAELNDRNSSHSVMSLLIFLHMLSCSGINV
jgi:hypothetical protein